MFKNKFLLFGYGLFEYVGGLMLCCDAAVNMTKAILPEPCQIYEIEKNNLNEEQ